MDLIAHWLKDEQGLRTELHQAMLAMGQQLHETPEAEQWPLRQWRSWLEENSFDLALLQQALQQLFANAGEAEPYAAICQELSQQPGDGPGIERLLGCAEHHSEALFPQLLEQLEAEAKATEELNKTSGGSASHHKLAQNMSNHRTAWSVGGGLLGMFLINRGWYGLKMRRVANLATCLEEGNREKSTLRQMWDGGNPDSMGYFKTMEIRDGRQVGYTKGVKFTQTYNKHWYGNTWDRKYADWGSAFKGTLQDILPTKMLLHNKHLKQYKDEENEKK